VRFIRQHENLMPVTEKRRLFMKRILVIGAHPDDELLGPGGTMARHVAAGDAVTAALIADMGSARYETETIRTVRECARQAAARLGIADICFAGLADQKLDTLPILEIVQWVEALMTRVQPHIIYTHHRGDINRDHTVVHEATLTAARPYSAPYLERILCYHTPSATEWAGPNVETAFLPNVFVDISSFLEIKLQAMAAYETELRPFPHPRSLEALRAQAAYWGSVIGATAAEPFILVREIAR
jgi:LmbE family N-acetylglucosaminyl deacetylase